jgi:hypothetical protein
MDPMRSLQLSISHYNVGATIEMWVRNFERCTLQMEMGEEAQRVPRLFTNNPVRVGPCSPLPRSILRHPFARTTGTQESKGVCHGFPDSVAVNRTWAAEWLSTFRVFGTHDLTIIRTSLLSRSLAR